MKITTLGFLATGALVFGACGGSSHPTVAPTISIISPANNATPTLGTDAEFSLPVTFTTTNFLLMAAGSSGCGVGCGHVNLFIDGAACNAPAMDQNSQGAASPVNALFGRCTTATGSHTITLELHNDDNSPLQDADGKTIAAAVTVTTATGNSGVPSIAITSPTDSASVALGIDVNKSVPIVFTTQNFTLAAAGTGSCGSGCGHVNLTIDGTACNAQGSPYNATGSASPISALFGLCPTAAGSHTLVATLRNDDDTILTAASAATVTFTTH